jgi:hypothetical protein
MAKPEYSEVWGKANAKEIGRLAQGIPGVVEGTNTFFFKPYNEIPKERRKVCDVCTHLLQLQTRKNRPALSENHRRRRSNQLSRRCWHTDGRYAVGQTFIQQRHFHQGCKIYVT